MDHILSCKGDCSIISGEGITKAELKSLEEKLGESVFSDLNKIKNEIEGGAKNKDTSENDLLSFLIGASALAIMT